jgi:surface protein
MVLSTILKNEYGFNFPTAAKHITFTDQPAPAGVETRDMSEAGDGGVVGWMQGDTFYVSTQRPGVKVTAPADCYHLFAYLDVQSKFTELDVTGLDTHNVTNMCLMFYNCTSLSNIDGLADWDTSNVINIGGIFYNCKSLASLDGLASWDVSHVTSMSTMFSGCTTLENIDALANWDVSNVTNMSHMFYDCTSLQNVDSLASWNTTNVTDIHVMFYGCKSLSNIDGLAGWDTHNVTDMCLLFDNCSSLTNVDALANWDVSHVETAHAMFDGCTSLSSESVEKFKAHHAEFTAESHSAQQPYIPKTQSPGKDQAVDLDP